jgi:lipopolysaccharide/colanic/teichoic acid biosynthesis glycosyltransferase
MSSEEQSLAVGPLRGQYLGGSGDIAISRPRRSPARPAVHEPAIAGQTAARAYARARRRGLERERLAPMPAWKRALDLALILVASPGLLLLGGVIAAAIKLGSPGPIFFQQRRIGYKGRPFVLFKFRTMRTGAETHLHQRHTQELIKSGKPMTKLDAQQDPRLVPLGRVLRASGLDELPQLINVLRGDMSLVGPRPCLPYEFDIYEAWQRRRCDAAPGLTGLWQVSGKNRTTFDRMVQLDIRYAKRKSLWLDLKIIFKTLPALWEQFRGR